MNRTILLHKRPLGRPEPIDFQMVQAEPPEIESGEILLKTIYVSVDPYVKGRMVVKR
jgi:NADPH-dependent curcumin reductase CurA